MTADGDEQAEGSSSARRTSQGAVSFRSLAAQPSLGSPPDANPGSFWRLLPVSEGSRRNSAAAAGPTPSWIASTPESAETVKRSPLTPFPPWASGGEAEGGPEPVLRARRLVGRRRALSTAVHGAVLFGQCVVTLAVFSVFVAVTVWNKGSTQSPFWDTLWNYVAPALGLGLALCAGTLALHEARVLSTVAVLWLEALMLTVTTATALGLWVCVLRQGAGQVVKGVVVGCVAMMLGTGVLAFLRAALVWRLEECGELGGGGDEDVGWDVFGE